uniref:Pectinesterase inhibitor domain-containing protein n=1 Tax=Leersia perrieri TaxID=77586 RepID=A0A0D9Y0D2_9ORYZ
MAPPPPLLAAVAVVLIAVAPPATEAVCVPRGKPFPSPPAKVTPPKPPTTPSPAKPSPPSPGKPTPVAPAGGDIVKALCAKTDAPILCQMSVIPPPPAKPPSDGAGVLRAAMSAVRSKSAAAKSAAAALAADPKTPALAKGPLKDCEESYDDIAYSLDHAEKAMAAGDKDTTGTMLDTVRTDVDTCDQGFEDREDDDVPPLLAKQDDELAKLASICIAIKIYDETN